MLTQQLRELERDGLVKRIQYEEIPPRVEYSSTELAHSLEPLFGEMVRWADKHRLAIQGNQIAYDERRENAIRHKAR